MRKEEHSQEQDRQIHELRQELFELQGRDCHDVLLNDVKRIDSDLSREQMSSIWDTLRFVCAHRHFTRTFNRPLTSSTWEPASVTQLKSDYYGCPSKHVLRRNRNPNFEDLELAVEQDQNDHSYSPREPKTSSQLVRDSQACVKLATKLLHRASQVSMKQDSAQDAPSFYEAQVICEESPPVFAFRSLNPERAKMESMELNQGLRPIVESTKLGLMEKIGRVCFNLVVSRHAPDIYTYNTLIVAFDKCRLSFFSDAIIWSFFNERLLRPSKLTFCAILNHFRVVGNRTGFLYALSCISGVDSRTGGKWRRRHFEDVEQYPLLVNWALDTTERTFTGDWFWQHIPLHISAVEHIISGLLDFEHFYLAATLFNTCGQSGIRLDQGVIRRLFDECIDSLDFGASLTLIRGLVSRQNNGLELLFTADDETNSYLVSRLYVLLDLCGLFQGSTGESFADSHLQNLNIDRQELGAFLKVLHLVQEHLQADDTFERPHCKMLQYQGTRNDTVTAKEAFGGQWLTDEPEENVVLWGRR
ncbi:hypothetical protein CDD81_304 [Ophiocordyceps australis]|uniref:Uncharacterized protein n=1 Tax=Ophiocordyceps australis TaxID=1399860 RepID=A0A2C5Y1I3_9HYPO|nr:hypothetical protein CDD81_304 [Ophiocordyceps australis]